MIDLNDIDWGAQVEQKSDAAGSGAEMTLVALKKRNVN